MAKFIFNRKNFFSDFFDSPECGYQAGTDLGIWEEYGQELKKNLEEAYKNGCIKKIKEDLVEKGIEVLKYKKAKEVKVESFPSDEKEIEEICKKYNAKPGFSEIEIRIMEDGEFEKMLEDVFKEDNSFLNKLSKEDSEKKVYICSKEDAKKFKKKTEAAYFVFDDLKNLSKFLKDNWTADKLYDYGVSSEKIIMEFCHHGDLHVFSKKDKGIEKILNERKEEKIEEEVSEFWEKNN